MCLLIKNRKLCNNTITLFLSIKMYIINDEKIKKKSKLNDT